jgi:hypothetical protein
VAHPFRVSSASQLHRVNDAGGDGGGAAKAAMAAMAAEAAQRRLAAKWMLLAKQVLTSRPLASKLLAY